jgi:hypothetical protein
MPATDTDQAIREALTAILDADPALRTEAGRTTRIVVEARNVAVNIPLPVLAYEMMTLDEGTGRAELLLTGIARGATSAAQARRMLELAKTALTALAFQAQGVDIVPLEGTRRSAELGETAVEIATAMEADPELARAEWVLPLLIL